MKKRDNWFLNIRFRRIVQISLVLLFLFAIFILVTEEKQIDSNKIKYLESIDNVSKEDVSKYLEESEGLDLTQQEREGIVEYRLKYDRFEEMLVLSEVEKFEFILYMMSEESMVEQEKHYIDELRNDFDVSLLESSIENIIKRDYPESLKSYEEEIKEIFSGILDEVNNYPKDLNELLTLSDFKYSNEESVFMDYRKRLDVLYGKYEKVDGDFILGDMIVIGNGVTR